ncbi:MAG: hypothetical protein KF780_10315 [Sphingomonas sp.]|nr:hypothetical protein [Sphingomonas sp.]
MEIADLPSENDAAAVLKFAMSFNGYKHHGSFGACAEAATQRKRDTVEAVRNELFFMCRTARHQGNNGYLETYRELRPILLELLRRSADRQP